jgi:hypothetical protein
MGDLRQPRQEVRRGAWRDVDMLDSEGLATREVVWLGN